MNRRFFLVDAVTALTLWWLALPDEVHQKKNLHTDFEYAGIGNEANILSPNADPRPDDMPPFRDVIYPYLNGVPQERVQAANAVEGWMDIIEKNSMAVKRVYGDVQLLWGTAERRKEFAKLYKQWR